MFQTDDGNQSDTGRPAANDVLFATRWCGRAKDSENDFRSFPLVTVPAAGLLAESSVRLPGVDGLAAGYDGSAHTRILGTSAVVAEDLVNLSRLPELCEASILARPFASGDGSGARVIARFRTR